MIPSPLSSEDVAALLAKGGDAAVPVAEKVAEPTAQDGGGGISSEQLSALMSKAPAAAQSSGGDQSYVAGLARSALGQGALMGWGDEVMAKLRQIAAGEDYNKALADERSKVAAFRKANPKTAVASEIAGSFATPGLGLLSGAVKPAASVLGRMVQGSAIGSGVGAIAGAGAADENRGEGAKQGATLGALVGPAAPFAAKLATGIVNQGADVLGPTLARLGARMPGSTGTPAEKAADFIMSRELQAGGETPAALRQRFADADRARTFHGGLDATNSSEAASPLMLSDVSPSFQKLAGSAVRASPETAARAEAVVGARQTGVAPQNAKAQGFADEAGLTTVNPLAEKVAGSVLDNPAGQHERLRGGLQRAYTLADKEHHGFAENAYRTEQDMLKALKENADKLYGEAKTAATGFNVNDAIEPVVRKMADEAVNSQVTEGRMIKRALQQFTTTDGRLVTTLDGFDKGKRALDSMIDKAGISGDRNAVRVLTDVKSRMLEVVDNISDNDIGKKYSEARGFFSGEKKRQEAIQWGRDALKMESNATADQFAAFPKDQQKLARLGILESLTTAAGPKRRADDLTRVLETNRAQDLLRETIPRSDKAGATYNTRPEQFGDYLANEKAMIASRDKVLGNSATASRLADDARLTHQTVGQMFDRFKSGNIGLLPLALEATSAGLTKVFGFREDVARELGKRLFTAKPAEREAILARLEANWGSDKVGQFSQVLNKFATATSVALPAQGGRSIGEARK